MSMALQKTPLRQVQSVRELLMNETARNQLAAVAAKNLSPDRMMRVVANAIRTTAKLQDCEPMSMLGALMTCASLGLEPNTPLGLAYLIPFENKRKGVVEVQLIIGYKGFAALARRSGLIESLHSDVVYSDDEFWSYEYGTDAHLRHKPGPRKGTKTHAYCYVKLKDGFAFVVLPWAHIMKVRDDKSQGWRTAVKFGKEKEHPWHHTQHEDVMAMKTVFRYMANRGEIPLSIEMMDTMDAEDGKPDFQGFAMDPTAGLQIDQRAEDEIDDREFIEGKTTTESAEPPAKNKKAASDAADRTSTTPETSAKATGEPKPNVEPRATSKPAEPKTVEASPFVLMIMREIEAEGFDVALELHEPGIENLARINPDQHALLMDLIAKARAEYDGDGQGSMPV